MEIYSSLDEITINEDTVVTIGNFDGVHLGHQSLIKRAVDVQEKRGLKSLLLTFENHPSDFLKGKHVRFLTIKSEKLRLIEDMGINIFVSLPFDERISGLEPEMFIRNVLIEKLRAKAVVVGYDFRFGKNRAGDIHRLERLSKDYGYSLDVIEPILRNGQKISSSLIRRMLSEGNVKEAGIMLGREYDVSGTIVHGRKLGRQIGFPTINIHADESALIPKTGVYYTKVIMDGREYCGATNVGYNPTIDGSRLSVETHIIGFCGDVYGKTARIIFLDRLRNEIKFNSIEELKKQLQNDVQNIKKLFTCKIQYGTIQSGN